MNIEEIYLPIVMTIKVCTQMVGNQYIILHGSIESDVDIEKLKDPLNTCWFEMRYLRDAGDIRISQRMRRQDPDKDP